MHLPEQLLTITFATGSISFALVNYHKKKNVIALEVFKNIDTTGAMVNGRLFNISFIEHQIRQFIEKYNCSNNFVSICLSSGALYERLVNIPNANPVPSDFDHLKIGSLAWDYIYLYPDEQGQFVFYVAGIRKEILFQYQLLCKKLSLNVVTLTTANQALLTLYHRLHGSAYRQVKLAHDMKHCNNQLHSLFTQDTLARLALIKPSIEQKDFAHALTAVALYLNEGSI